MSDTILTFDNIADYRYDPWTNTESPKQIGYGVNDPEVRTIPNSAPYELTLFEAPQENTPSTTEIRNYATDELFFEVSKTTTPANKQYRVNYDEKGIGRIQFNAAQAGTQIKIKYYGLGTLLKKDTIAVKLEGVADYVFAAVDSSAAAQDMADDVVAGGEDFGALLNTQITALSDGGRIKIMAGTYNVSTKITLNNNVILSGDGKGTEIKCAANLDPLVDITGNNTKIDNICFDGESSTYNTGFFNVSGSYNIIKNCYITDFDRESVIEENGDYFKFINNTLNDTDGIDLEGGNYVIISDNYFDDVGGTYALSLNSNGFVSSDDVLISNNWFYSTVNGIQDGTACASKRVNIKGNNFLDNSAAINLTESNVECIITGNIIDNCTSRSVNIIGLNYVTFSNNKIKNGSNIGLYLENNDFCTITGNVIEGNGGGIDCNNVDDSTIQANIVYNNTGTQIILDASSNANVVKNNQTVSGSGLSSITDNGTNNSVQGFY